MRKLGEYLRQFRLDELQQLFTVIRDVMSFVGSRPEEPYVVNLLSKDIHYHGLRHSVKPGITGWAQGLYPYGVSVQDAYEKHQYNPYYYYAKHMSLGFDLWILLNTFQVVLSCRERQES